MRLEQLGPGVNTPTLLDFIILADPMGFDPRRAGAVHGCPCGCTPTCTRCAAGAGGMPVPPGVAAGAEEPSVQRPSPQIWHPSRR
eukprot:705587-Pelagomonas_calceolata.AAC.4